MISRYWYWNTQEISNLTYLLPTGLKQQEYP